MTYLRKSPPVAAFTAMGFLEREYFRHTAVAIRKQYPDTFLLLEKRGVPQAELTSGAFFQLNLYSDHLAGLPGELFMDRQINWHGQQLGQTGLIAAAGLYLCDNSLTITVMQSDLCQQLSRHPELKRISKTQVENRFGYWYRMLFNAILDFAMENAFSSVRCPTSHSIIQLIAASIRADLFERIYDSPCRHYSCRRVREGPAEYWETPVSGNSNRVARLEPTAAKHGDQTGASICIFHDIEENIDTDIAPIECRKSLTAMLDIEKRLDIKASYNVVGTLFRSKRDEIRGIDPRHSLAFHSFNHDLSAGQQLERCREVDLQVRGYRPPRSVISAELTDYRLSYFNFEWIASGQNSGGSSCCLQNGIVRIPIVADDYPMFAAKMDYSVWESELLEIARNSRFIAFGLHDCYAPLWLHSYPKLLEKLQSIGTFVTADEVCDQVFRQQGAELNPRTVSALGGEQAKNSGWEKMVRWSRRKRARAISRISLFLRARRSRRVRAM